MKTTFTKVDLIAFGSTLVVYIVCSWVLNQLNWTVIQQTAPGYNFLQPHVNKGLAAALGFVALIVVLQIARRKGWRIKNRRVVFLVPLIFLIPPIINLSILTDMSDFFGQPVDYTEALRSTLRRIHLIYLTALMTLVILYRWKAGSSANTQTI